MGKINVKVDQQNIIHIDPNTINENGVVKNRYVNQENLVVYANLEAELIPRSKMLINDGNTSLVNVATGTFNMLHNDGKDFNTLWTDVIIGDDSDQVIQNFGITNIQINVTASSIPRVSITFVDVRGHVLLNNPPNSPYRCLYHKPWPIFYLTLKGYYGKSIRYKLHLVEVKNKYNSSTSNFEIYTKFVASTYALLSDINLQNILDAPYMYPIETTNVQQTNTKNNTVQNKIIKSTKGYNILKSVYQDYKRKKLIPNDFPNITLRELIMKSSSLSKLIESELYDSVVNPKILGEVKSFEDLINDLINTISTYQNKYVDLNTFVVKNNIKYYKLNPSNNNLEIILGNTKDSLYSIFNIYSTYATKNIVFGDNIDKTFFRNAKLNISPIKLTILLSKLTNNEYHIFENNNYYLSFDKINSDLNDRIKEYNRQRNVIEDFVETKMNEIVKNKNLGLGFIPTIRNIFAVICANADVYLRLFNDVHTKCIEVSNERYEILKKSNLTASEDENIYPFPQILRTVGNKESVLTYPGDKEVKSLLKSDDTRLWPEIEFIEKYIEIGTKKIDPLATKTPSVDNVQYVFDNNSDIESLKPISNSDFINEDKIYSKKTISDVLYEIYERLRYLTFIGDYDNNSLLDIRNAEFENISNFFKYDDDILTILKSQVKTIESLISLMKKTSENNKYINSNEGLFVTEYIRDNTFSLKKFNNVIRSSKKFEFSNYNTFLNNYTPKNDVLFKYPLNSTFISNKHSKKYKDLVNYNDKLTNNDGYSFLSTPKNGSIWLKEGFSSIFDNSISINDIDYNILNLKYFHKQLFDDYHNNKINEKYVSSAYLFLSTIPLVDLSDIITINNGKTIVASLFNDISITNYLPRHQILKFGAMYYRYKKIVNEKIDIINNSFNDVNYNSFYNNNKGLNFITKDYKTSSYGDSTYNDNNKNVYPYYFGVYNKIIKGFSFYNNDNFKKTGGDIFDNVEYNNAVVTNKIIQYNDLSNSGNNDNWNNFIDLNLINGTKELIILPNNFSFNDSNNDNTLKLIIDENDFDYSIYNKTIFDNTFFNQNEINLLLSTFSLELLESFEKEFIDFSSLSMNDNPNTFQSLLNDISTISYTDINVITDKTLLKNTQINKLNQLNDDLLSTDSLYELINVNPKNYDIYKLNELLNYNGLKYDGINDEKIKLIKLYIGDSTLFITAFERLDIQINNDNVLKYKPYIHLFAGLILENNDSTKTDFNNFILNNIVIPSNDRFNFLSNKLVSKFNEFNKIEYTSKITDKNGYNDDKTLKLELYSYFKSFNDKWIGGNSIVLNGLLNEFLFLDKGNTDIGDKAYLSLEKLIDLGNTSNANISFYSIITMLIKDTGFDMRPLPSYVNFYQPDKKMGDIAETLFGTYLDVDYLDTSPKIVLQFIGPTSKILNLKSISPEYKYKDDSFYIGDTTNNHLLATDIDFDNTDINKSNKIVSFDVNVGDQNQNIFISVDVDQSSFKNTSEALEATEMLGRSESGVGTYQVDISLFDIYRQASYTAEVKSMLNFMIQPTMYFYLNLPIYEGTYYISEVSHNMGVDGSNVTSFKGYRLSNSTLPELSEYYVSSYRSLFDKLIDNVLPKNNLSDVNLTTDITISTNNSVSSVNLDMEILPNEVLVTTSGHLQGIPYNGYSNTAGIQYVKLNDEGWLKSKVSIFNTTQTIIDDNEDLELISGVNNYATTFLNWKDIKNDLSDSVGIKFISELVNKNKILEYDIELYNPLKNKRVKIITNFNPNIKKYNNIVYNVPLKNESSVFITNDLAKKLNIYSNNEIIYFKIIKK